jgi:hypothetical protein
MPTSTVSLGLPLVAVLVALPVAVVAAGCGGPELPPAASPGPLAGCQLTEEPGVRTWQCGELLALELAAGAASEGDVRAVLEDFAEGFAANAATRSDAPYGERRYPSVRLEGQTPAGQRFVAQMVVVNTHEGARVVQCASRSPVAPCEPVLAHLVGGRP